LSNAGRQDDEAIELAFSKKKIEERKAWLAGFQPGTYLDQSVDQISYTDFVNKVSDFSDLGTPLLKMSVLCRGLVNGDARAPPEVSAALQLAALRNVSPEPCLCSSEAVLP
jgi:hypothetical protein